MCVFGGKKKKMYRKAKYKHAAEELVEIGKGTLNDSKLFTHCEAEVKPLQK